MRGLGRAAVVNNKRLRLFTIHPADPTVPGGRLLLLFREVRLINDVCEQVFPRLGGSYLQRCVVGQHGIEFTLSHKCTYTAAAAYGYT